MAQQTKQIKKNSAAVKLGRKGGSNSRKYIPAEEARLLAQRAVTARWDAYYKAHPEKLKQRQEREAQKAAKAGKR